MCHRAWSKAWSSFTMARLMARKICIDSSLILLLERRPNQVEYISSRQTRLGDGEGFARVRKSSDKHLKTDKGKKSESITAIDHL